MFNGRFTREDGLIMPNTITEVGRQQILSAAFRGEPMNLYAALVFGSAGSLVLESDLLEPTIGVNGYTRIPLAQNDTDWETLDMEGALARISTKVIEWEAVGGDFDQEVNRVALMLGDERDNAANVWSVGSVWLESLVITPTTPANLRQFSYSVRV